MADVSHSTFNDIRQQMVILENARMPLTFPTFVAYDVQQNDAVVPFSFRLPIRRVPVPFSAQGTVAAAGQPLARSAGWTYHNLVQVFIATAEFDPKDYGGMSKSASDYWDPYFNLYLPQHARTLNPTGDHAYVSKLTIVDSREAEFDLRWYGLYFDFEIEQYATLTV